MPTSFKLPVILAGIALAAASLTTGVAHADVQAPLAVRIIAINDFHGNLDGANLDFRSDVDRMHRTEDNGERTGVAAGGIDYMAGLVRQLRSAAKHSVVVSAGDLIGASPLNSALFHDEPTIEAMNRLGLDFSAVGNHEFDEGKDELLRMQAGGCHPVDPNSCQGDKVGTPYPFEGAAFKFLAANVDDTTKGSTLFPPYGVREFEGIRVAFIGMTLKSTPSIVAPSGVAGLVFRNEADTVNALIGKLKGQGIEAVVILLHEGGYAAGGINGCESVSGPIVDIVRHLDDAVDLVISGHTHRAYNCRLPNRSGRPITVTSAGSFGRLITNIDLDIDRSTRDVVAIRAENRLVDRTNALGSRGPIVPDSRIAALVARYNALVAPIASRVIGSIAADFSRRSNASGESPLGDFVADAQLAATEKPERGGAVVALMNPGGLRTDLRFAPGQDGKPDGAVTYGEAFKTQPFGNSLVVMTLTGQQLYDVLEQQWTAQQPAGGRILQVSKGFSYRHTFTPGVSPAGEGHVCNGTVTVDGRPVDRTGHYRVAVNAYLAAGGDQFTTFQQGTDRLGGGMDVDALAAYLESRSPVPVPRPDRIERVASCDEAIPPRRPAPVQP